MSFVVRNSKSAEERLEHKRKPISLGITLSFDPTGTDGDRMSTWFDTGEAELTINNSGSHLLLTHDSIRYFELRMSTCSYLTVEVSDAVSLHRVCCLG